MWDTASPRISWALRLAWGIIAVICIISMQLYPGEQAIPLHVIWIGLALAYGFTVWRPVELAIMVAITGTATSVILVRQAAQGWIAWSETAEVPMGAILIAVVAWHIRRRHHALQQMAALAEHERRQSESREVLLQQVSHELRTPITIARGYTESIRDDVSVPSLVDDATVVLGELDKLDQITQRLVTLMQIEGPYQRKRVSLDSVLTQIVRRWMSAATRQWEISSMPGEVLVNPDRLEVAVDCLLDNAVKFTGPDDQIKVRGVIDGQSWRIEITDTGRGMSAKDAAALADAQPIARQSLSGTGLGLIVVRGIVGTWGGSIDVRSAPALGTTVILRFPQDQAMGT